MLVKRIATYLSIFNCFPVIQPVSSKVRHFSTFFANFGLPRVRPWDNRGKCYMMERGFNAGQMPHSMYPSIFNLLRAIERYWSEIATFLTPLAFNEHLYYATQAERQTERQTIIQTKIKVHLKVNISFK